MVVSEPASGRLYSCLLEESKYFSHDLLEVGDFLILH